MKTLIACTVFIVAALAEPPVDNRYLPPQQGGSGLSQQYGPPNAGFGAQRQTDAVFRGRPSSNYGAPSRPSSRRPSNQYGPPRSQPNSQYIPPSNTPSNQYGAPSFQSNQPSNNYLPPSNSPSNQFGAPSSQYGAPSSQSQPSNQYGAPSFQSQPSNQYSTPSFQSQPSNQYGAPAANQPSSQYGAPQFGSGQNGFGRPSRPSSAPSQQYGAPGASGIGGNQQFGGAQNRQYLPPGGGRGGYGGDDEGNGEPANYSFEYMVKDEESGNDFGHRESRMGDRAEGLYYVLLPDGRKQTVEYEADQEGYRPKISYEDTGAGAAGAGYDRNSQDRSQGGYQNGGPY